MTAGVTDVTATGTYAAPRIRQGLIAGPSRRLDARINAVRADVADAALADIVIAPRYAEGVHRYCRASSMLFASPDKHSLALSQLLVGETFIVFDQSADWAWGQCLNDRYVAWVRRVALAPTATAAASHRVAVPVTAVFSAPALKASVVGSLPLGARVAADPESSDPYVATDQGFVWRDHLRALADTSNDAAALALGFVGTPYVWGGRTRSGIDCSGLTQVCLQACGVQAPRDSDQQTTAFPAISADDRRRGDLVVFPGHVGMLVDPDTLVHANAHFMMTVVEPLAEASKRLAPTGFRRPQVTVATSC